MGVVIKLLRYVIGAVTSIIVGYLAIENWVDSKVQAGERRILTIREEDLSSINKLRESDLMHFNKRLDSIDNKLDVLIGGNHGKQRFKRN